MLNCLARANKDKFNCADFLCCVYRLIIVILFQLYYNILTDLNLNEGNVGN
jgi:hypothetical protein